MDGTLDQFSFVRALSGKIEGLTGNGDGKGYMWYYCENQGNYGYIRSDMVYELSLEDYQKICPQPTVYTKDKNVPTFTKVDLGNNDFKEWLTQNPNLKLKIPPTTLGVIKVTTAGANVRTNPGTGTNAKAIGRVSVGEMYDVLAKDATTGWYQFTWKDGQEVWISAQVVDFIPTKK